MATTSDKMDRTVDSSRETGPSQDALAPLKSRKSRPNVTNCRASRNRRFAMITRRRVISIFFALAVFAGCASTNVTQQTPMASPGLARPDQIWVYDFIADLARLPADSSIGPRPQYAPHAA